jgi:dienelactone hydrolase
VTEVIEWLEERPVQDGVVERSFLTRRGSSNIPGLLWLPPTAAPAVGLVLLGHGGSGHKRTDRIVCLGRWFASQAGLAAMAIDGPYHGDRDHAPLPRPVYQARMAAEGMEIMLDRMTADWLAAVAALGDSGIADTSTVGYLGMSMGTRFGLPLAAAMGAAMRCVVFGKFGLRQAATMSPGLLVPSRVASDARRITAPTLFHLQWHDEVFPREGQLELFDLLASPDKQLIAYAGRHAETKPEAVAVWRDFVSRHLAARFSGPGQLSPS